MRDLRVREVFALVGAIFVSINAHSNCPEDVGDIVASELAGQKLAVLPRTAEEAIVLLEPIIKAETYKVWRALAMDLDDLRQEARLWILVKFGKFQPDRGTNPKTYFSQVIRNRLMGLLKHSSRKKRAGRIDRDVEVETIPKADSELSREEFQNEFGPLLSEALKGEKPETREILQLYFEGGLTFEKIAEMHGVTKQAVHNRVERAINRLKERTKSKTKE